MYELPSNSAVSQCRVVVVDEELDIQLLQADELAESGGEYASQGR